MNSESLRAKSSRETVLVDGSEARRRLLEMAGCDGEGRQQALALDPSLAVDGIEEESFDDDDLQRVKDAVLQARRLQEVERRRVRPASWLRAAGLVLVLGLSALSMPKRIDLPATSATGPVVNLQAVTEFAALSAVEAIDRPLARVYELVEDDFSVVMIVDDSFDL